MGPTVTSEQVVDALRTVIDPEIGRDIVSLGMVKDLAINGGDVDFTLVLTSAACPLRAHLQQAATQAVLAIPGVKTASIEVTARGAGQHENISSTAPSGPLAIPGVKHVIAVASGKGGVGKSTVSVNLAIALAKRGHRVGLMDADVTGPNIPLMMGIRDGVITQNEKMVPAANHGIKVMSIGFFTTDDTPIIWRGSLVSRAIQQFLHDVEWGELDYLIVDLPPGTGDVPLTLIKTIPLSGAVIVSTPQDVALLDARKALVMFRKLDVPILGIVENMSYYICHHCGEMAEIFGAGGGERISREYGTTLLGRIPLDENVRSNADAGTPVALNLEAKAAVEFLEIADRVTIGVGSFCDACHSQMSY